MTKRWWFEVMSSIYLGQTLLGSNVLSSIWGHSSSYLRQTLLGTSVLSSIWGHVFLVQRTGTLGYQCSQQPHHFHLYHLLHPSQKDEYFPQRLYYRSLKLKLKEEEMPAVRDAKDICPGTTLPPIIRSAGLVIRAFSSR